MTIFQTMIQRIQAGFSAPRRRAAAGRHSLVTAGLECLEGRRVMSADGWLPGLINFETESNDTRATADSIAVTSVTNPNADVIFTGGIRSTNDVDYYKFTLHKTSAVQLDVYKLNPSMQLSGDVDLKLEDSSGQELAISNRGGGSSERINKELAPGTYFIKVYPYDYTGFGVSYQVRLQSTASTAPDPAIVPETSIVTGPSNTNDPTPTFAWTSATNATRYELWVNNKVTRQRVLHETNLTETSHTPGSDLVPGTYTIWVRAWNGNLPGIWSQPREFTLSHIKPGTSIITAPSNTDDTTPTFTWTSATNATRYELWVNNKVTRQRVLHQTNLTETSHTPGSDLAAGTYTVWVRAWNGDVPGAWSAGRDFTVTPTINIDDPNGPNNTWQQATLLRHLGFGVGLPSVKHDRLTQNDKSDFFKVTWDRSRTHVSISLKVSVTEGDVADLRVKVYRLYNGVLSEITVFNQSRSGNTVTLSSNPMIVNSRFTGLYYEVTSVTGKANLGYRIEG